MPQDAVVAIVPDLLIGEVLPSLHRAGLGHIARLVRAKPRNPLLAQLQRAGIPVSQAPELVAGAGSVLVVNAAARSPMAGSLLLRLGATTVWTVTAMGAWMPIDDVVVDQPGIHVLPPHPLQRVPGRDPQQRVTLSRPASAQAEGQAE